MNVRVNVAYPRISPEGVEFVRQNKLSPEFYFTSDNLSIIGENEIKRLKEVVELCGSELTVHAPFACVDMGSKDEKVRNNSLDVLLKCLRLSVELKASVMVVHPGYGAQTKGIMTEEWIYNAGKHIMALVSEAENRHIKIAFENIFDRVPNSLNDLLKIADSEYAGICFDIGHCNLFSKVPMQEWLNVLGDKIVECHLHDNDRSDDQHKAVGSGTSDYMTFSKWYKSLDDAKKPVLTLEHRSRSYITESLAALKGLGI